MGATHIDLNAMISNTLASMPSASTSVLSASTSSASIPVTIAHIELPTQEECKTYIVAQRRASNQAEHIVALRSFTGYDFSQPVGMQVDAARRLCQRILSPVEKATAAYTRSSALTLNGYVAGMPDNQAKEIRSLQAQCRALIDDISKAEFARASTKDIESSLRTVRARLVSLGATEQDDIG